MKRIYIPIAALEIYDDMHKLQPDGSFIVDEEKDGQTTQQHVDSIEYIKGLLANGQKVRPILVRDNGDGTYLRLDGFKRAIAQHQMGWKLVEAFVCTQKEYDDAAFVDYDGQKMRCWHGGQEKEHYSLQEGGERPNFNYDDTVFLYKGTGPDQLRIEVSECIHVHWGDFGRFRLALGGRDFVELANAIISIHGQDQ